MRSFISDQNIQPFFFSFVADENDCKKVKLEREQHSPLSGKTHRPADSSSATLPVPKSSGPRSHSHADHGDKSLSPVSASGAGGAELPACQILNKSGSRTPVGGASSHHGGLGGSGNKKSPLSVGGVGQCQYLGGQSPPYGLHQGSTPPGCDQVYYPHHTAASNMAMQMANSGLLQHNSGSSGLLQPVTTGLGLPHVNQQMSACQLAGQNSACALASSNSSAGSYGLGGSASSQGHSALSSCTYMQPNQTYPSHMSVMNFASTNPFANPMA